MTITNALISKTSVLACVLVFFVCSAGGFEVMVPQGGTYETEVLREFVRQTTARAGLESEKGLFISVLPITYPSSASGISDEERETNLKQAKVRADQLEELCGCFVEIAPIQSIDDANDESLVGDYYSKTREIHGLYIPGGDQTVAMQIVAGNLLETALEERDMPIVGLGGTSAGCAVESVDMLAGYSSVGEARLGLVDGSIELWTGEKKHGLHGTFSWGTIDQHFNQRGRFLRLLQAAARVDGKLGMGIDRGTGTVLTGPGGQFLESVVGLGSVLVVDHSTADISVTSEGIYNVMGSVAHLIPSESSTGFDFQARSPVGHGGLELSPKRPESQFSVIPSVDGISDDDDDDDELHSGVLIFGDNFARDPVVSTGAGLDKFVESVAPAITEYKYEVLVLGIGFDQEEEADSKTQSVLGELKARFQAAGVEVDLTAGVFVGDEPDYGLLEEWRSWLEERGAGVYIYGGSPETICAQREGADILNTLELSVRLINRPGFIMAVDGDASRLAGNYMSCNPIDESRADREDHASEQFIEGWTDVRVADPWPGSGLKWAFEPSAHTDYGYGRLWSLMNEADVVFSIPVEGGIWFPYDASHTFGTVGSLEASFLMFETKGSQRCENGAKGGLCRTNVALSALVSGQALEYPKQPE